jgi:hypothetical protein
MSAIRGDLRGENQRSVENGLCGGNEQPGCHGLWDERPQGECGIGGHGSGAGGEQVTYAEVIADNRGGQARRGQARMCGREARVRVHGG